MTNPPPAAAGSRASVPPSPVSRALAWVVVAGLLAAVAYVAVDPGGRSAPRHGEDGLPAAAGDDGRGSTWVDPTGAPLPGEGRPVTDDSGLLPISPGELLDYPVVERSGKELRTHDLLDRFLVVDFIFTNCPGVCIPMAERMRELQDETRTMDDVRLVSFTVDPARDSPEVLAKYADKVGAEAEAWYFLFTQKVRVQAIAYKGMKLGAADDPVIHSSKFVLVDRAGRVRGYYAPLRDDDWKSKLVADLDTLRREVH
jgi:protein SCO1/2